MKLLVIDWVVFLLELMEFNVDCVFISFGLYFDDVVVFDCELKFLGWNSVVVKWFFFDIYGSEFIGCVYW